MADYPVLDGSGGTVVEFATDPAFVASPYDNSDDYPVLDANGDVIVQGGSYSPLDEGNVAAWFDFYDDSTVAVVGTAMESVTSKSSAGQVYSQTTASNQPTYSANAVGDKSAMLTGYNEFLLGPEISGAFFIVVYRHDGTTYAQPLLGDQNDIPDFRGGTNPKLFLDTADTEPIRDGDAWLNGTSVADPILIDRPTSLSMLAFEPTVTHSFDSLSRDREVPARAVQGLYCQVFVMSVAPDAAARERLFNFFMAQSGIS